MTIALNTDVEFIDYSTCLIPTNLVIGKTYRLTGLSQGSLGSYSIETTALSATQFADSVKVFPALATPTLTGWPGIFNFAICLLTYLHDNKNNKVNGGNVATFPWFPATSNNVRNNIVDNGATCNLGGNTFAGVFHGNEVSADSSVVISGAAQLSTILSISNNTFKRGSLVISNAMGTLFQVSGNVFDRGVISQIGANAFGSVLITNNHISANAVIEIGNSGTIFIDVNHVSGGKLSVQPATGNSHTVQRNTIIAKGLVTTGSNTVLVIFSGNVVANTVTLTSGPNTEILNNYFSPSSELILSSGNVGSVIVARNNIFGRVIISNLEAAAALTFAHSLIAPGAEVGTDALLQVNAGAGPTHVVSFLTMASGSLFEFHTNTGNTLFTNIMLGPKGRLMDQPAGGAGVTLDGIYIENGTLDYAHFAASNIRLEGINSTLIASTSNATKTGYVNALP